MGTGTLDMIGRCIDAGLPEPQFAVTDRFVTTVWRAPVASHSSGRAVSGAQPRAGVQVGVQAGLSDREVAMLRACVAVEATSKDLQTAAGYAGRTRSFERDLNPLLREELLEMTVPDRPTSPAQRYGVTAKGRTAIASIDETTRTS